MNQFQLIVLLEVMAYTMLPNQAAPIKACGNDLIDALKSVCGDRGFYSPPQGYSRRTPAAQSGIATRCCNAHCEISFLEKYCNTPATSQSQTAAAPLRITSTVDDRRANEVVVDHSDEPGNAGSQTPRVEDARGRDGTTNRTKPSSTETDEDSYSTAEEGKPDESSPSERVENPLEEDEANKEKPTHRPAKSHSRERGKNRTSKGSDRRSNNSRRKSSSERRALSSERREARQRRKQQREKRRQSNSNKRKSRAERKGTSGETPVTTPIAVETAEHPFKNVGYNSTSGDVSLVNVTDSDTAPSPDAKKDGFFTTITAVLRDVIGFQQTDDGNR